MAGQKVWLFSKGVLALVTAMADSFWLRIIEAFFMSFEIKKAMVWKAEQMVQLLYRGGDIQTEEQDQDRATQIAFILNILAYSQVAYEERVDGEFSLDFFDIGVWVIRSKEWSYVVFRGTTHWQDVIDDITISTTDGKTHDGFKRAFQRRLALVLDKYLPFLKSDATKNVIICGHSLGGAVAQLFYKYLQDQVGVKIYLRTFNAPPAGICEWMSASGSSDVLHLRSNCDAVSNLSFAPTSMRVLNVKKEECEGAYTSVELDHSDPVSCHDIYDLYKSWAHPKEKVEVPRRNLPMSITAQFTQFERIKKGLLTR